ncbi:DEAD/DEAH box helicase domain [Dillenia turbinata]|uniref:ATP-dependent RNA helicase n=1 Tax=Dillenia turbinata TaxID=194707 RepID=A0AAN8VA99_9MAGN
MTQIEEHNVGFAFVAKPKPKSAEMAAKKKAKRRSVQDGEAEGIINSLHWKPSLPSETNDQNFSLFVGTNDLEGGFLSLEEIDESEYGIPVPVPGVEDAKQRDKPSGKLKKRKRNEVDVASSDVLNIALEEEVEDKEEDKTKKKKMKKKKKKKKKKIMMKKLLKGLLQMVFCGLLLSLPLENLHFSYGYLVISLEVGEYLITLCSDCHTVVSNDKHESEEESVDEAEFYAWNELRLHPLLMRSIFKLGFKEPTPIQKACIPAGAHQGKDVVGAAETGSGKTLAFGLPILQRLLEEREKASKLVEENNDEEAAKRVAPDGLLRALFITPTRELALQVTDHLKAVAEGINVRVVPVVGGMSTEKQERLLKARPEIIVGTPGRLWELMSRGENHLVEVGAAAFCVAFVVFFVLDEADRMIEGGHFHELQSIVDLLPMGSMPVGETFQNVNCMTVQSFQKKKRQAFVFSATIALSAEFRKKLKQKSLKSISSSNAGFNSIEALFERAGMRADAAVIDLTKASIVAEKLVESYVECREEDKDAHLYYILTVNGQGRTIVFCTSIAAVRHISAILRILGLNVLTLHAQMQQRARLKAVDRFRGNEQGVLVATDVAARGLDIAGVRTVVHYQLPHTAEIYVHRSGRTARASSDGCSIALISPKDRSKFASLCKSFSKDTLLQFPIDQTYMPGVAKRLSLAHQIDNILRKESKEKAKSSWLERNAESLQVFMDDYESEEKRVNSHKQKKASSVHLTKLQEELNKLLASPLQPKTFSRRYFTGAGVSPLLQHQFEELAWQKMCGDLGSGAYGKGKLVNVRAPQQA